MAEPDYLALSLGDFLDRMAAATPAPSAGAAAAATVALAAGLTAMSAGLSDNQMPEAQGVAARALELQRQVRPLGQRDAEAYGEVLSAQGRSRDDPGRDAAVREALAGAADVPLEIAEVGLVVLDLAADVVRRGNRNLRGDALTACLLAQAGVRSACLLVGMNLTDPQDPRQVRAAEMDRTAREATIPVEG